VVIAPYSLEGFRGFQDTHPLISTGTGLGDGKDIMNAVFLQIDIDVQAKVD